LITANIVFPRVQTRNERFWRLSQLFGSGSTGVPTLVYRPRGRTNEKARFAPRRNGGWIVCVSAGVNRIRSSPPV